MIENASLDWNEQGAPVSSLFDDVYFSKDNGLQETRHVFLNSNQLPERIFAASSPPFVVAETGFGTGLNFLTLWQSINEVTQTNLTHPRPRLHFISFEKYPLTLTDLIRSHQQWPELAALTRQLQQQWPQPLPGCQRLEFDQGRIILDLWFGDVNTLIHHLPPELNQGIDAWFLDGFAPSKNPEMWTQGLFDSMARLTAEGGSFATFTAAGFVRRGLQQAGFTVSRTKGFGVKREMLAGTRQRHIAIPPPTPWYHRTPGQSTEIAIIGGGVASACLLHALGKRGYEMSLYSQDQRPAANASGNRQAAVYPLLNPVFHAMSEFFPAAFSYARRYYDNLDVDFEHDWCGVLQLFADNKDEAKRQRILAMQLPDTFVQPLNAKQASQIAGLMIEHHALFYPQGGWLSPCQLTEGLIEQAHSNGVHCHWQKQLQHLTQLADGSWLLTFADGTSAQHQQVVLANGHRITQFSQSRALPLYSVAGQVSHITASKLSRKLDRVLCYDGYLTPVSPNSGTHCLGASYRRHSDNTAFDPQEQIQNYQRLKACLPTSPWVNAFESHENSARCSVRCATRDHLPVVGALPDFAATLALYQNVPDNHVDPEKQLEAPVWRGLFVLGALGSRGLTSAPLLAEVLAAQINQEPQPLSHSTLNALQPNRQWIRKLLKGRPIQPHMTKQTA